MQSPSLIGEVLDGRYRITRKLGEGGMGEVYAAEHVHIEKRFAIKLLRPEIVSNPEAVSRFRQEARSSSSIGHRNIIAIEDFGSLADGRIYMCMELLNGAALNDLIMTPQPVERLLNILIQTGHGLAAAHAKNIVHRDMKPENIFVTIGPNNEDVPKLLDFGIAKVAGNDGQNNLTRTGTIFGTPFYMAPEQALGNPVDARTDIYAMGVIMYEVFAGSLPFQGESFMGILTQHITTEPEPVAQRAAKAGRSLPPGLADIITRCMQKNPAHRFGTMDELVNALVQIYRGVAGAGMSTYMEAFPGRAANPTPGPMSAQHGSPAVTPTVGVGTPPPMHHGHGTAPHQIQQPGTGPIASGGNYAVSSSGSGLYSPNSSVVTVPKKSNTGLIIAIIAVLAVGGGIAAFALTSGGGKGGGSGSQVASGSDHGSSGSNGSAGSSAIGIGSSGSSEIKGSDSGSDHVGPGSDHVGSGSDVVAVGSGSGSGTTVDVGSGSAGSNAGSNEPPIALPVKVKITLKQPVAFEAWENGAKLPFEGPDFLDVLPGQSRTITLKARGYKDKTVTITDKEKTVKFKLDKAPSSTPPNVGSGSGSAVVKPPTLDCSSGIKDPKNAGCVKQYCKAHPENPSCDAE
ncbi:MAG TPA: serine/threonine-protein kinase [Kofleriaceae bacterium]|nr:serine/threonine-protein kinase [Kofleriaceae bacterium]